MSDEPSFSWDDLRHFLLAAQAGTLAGAARAAGVQHTTIGRRLGALERSLGTALFLRGPDGLTLTPTGELLLPLAQRVANDMLAVREFAASRRNRVRLALPSGFIALFAADLARLARERPEITLETVSGSALADLQRGDADLALRIGPIRDPDLVSRPIGEIGSSLYAAPRYLHEQALPVDPSDLSGHRVIGFGAELSGQPASRWWDTRAAGAEIVLRTNEMTTMVEAAASGLGLALLPCMLADPDPRLVRLVPEVLSRRSLSLVYRREHRGNRPLRAVAAFLIDALRARADLIGGTPGTTHPTPG